MLEGTSRNGRRTGDQLRTCLHCPESWPCPGKRKRGREKGSWVGRTLSCAGGWILLQSPLSGNVGPFRKDLVPYDQKDYRWSFDLAGGKVKVVPGVR